MTRNRSKKDTWEEHVEGHQARTRRWYRRQLEFTREQKEILAASADLDPESSRGELFVEAVSVLCGSLPGRAQAVDVGRPGTPMRDELLALEQALVAIRDGVDQVSGRMLALSSAAEERLAHELGSAEPGRPKALWKLRERLQSELSPLQAKGSSLTELRAAAGAAAEGAPGQGGGRPPQRAKAATIKELAAVFQLVHQRTSDALERAFAYFFALLRPILDDGQKSFAPEPSETELDEAYQWCRNHRVPRLRERVALDDAELKTRLRDISPAFTSDRVVSATEFDAEHTARVNSVLASQRPDTQEGE